MVQPRQGMEATFYEDSRYREKTEVARGMKRPMTLDLDSTKFSKKGKVTTLLTSPDLNMLKLASPELERMIIAQHGLVTSTPTPNQCMYNSKPNDDREYQQRDFTDALPSLNQNNNNQNNMYQSAMHSDNGLGMPCPPPSCSVNSMDNTASYYPQTTNCNSILVSSSGPVNTGMVGCYNPPNYYMNSGNISVKEEPQTVPCMGVTPPLSPIDMESQEKIKLERKRLRNRIAASKCRRRKLERIARLEDKVSLLKGENSELSNVVNQLREQVCTLKQQVMDHVRCGCEILNFRPDMQF